MPDFPASFTATLDEAATLLARCHAIAPVVEQAGQALVACLRAGGKILTCGNGGSAADALHMAEELVGRYRGDRPSLPAICLNCDASTVTCIANDYGFDHIFARQVEGYGRPGDFLVAFTTSGNSTNVLRALSAARAARLSTLVVTGRDGGNSLPLADLAVIVPHTDTGRIQEVHTLVLHHWLELVEHAFPPAARPTP